MCTDIATQQKSRRIHLSIRPHKKCHQHAAKHVLSSYDAKQRLRESQSQIQTRLPKLVSTGSDFSDFERELNAKLYPVTGSYSDVLQDYHVFPQIIGSGHYGKVRECVHRQSRQIFAVKTIDKSKISRMDHLRREISMLQEMNHDRIMKMVDCYEDQDYVHIVTEKYDGGELFDRVAQNTSPGGCFSESAAVRIIKSLLEAVQFLHNDRNVVHRDIKPENILFESSDENADIKLIDFGLAKKHYQGQAPMTNSVGTAYYMAPEVLRGSYDKSCDIWSIGIVTYILLCGYPPFNGNSDKEIYGNIKNGELSFAGYGWRNPSKEARHFISSLLRRDTKCRLNVDEALCHPWIVNNSF